MRTASARRCWVEISCVVCLALGTAATSRGAEPDALKFATSDVIAAVIVRPALLAQDRTTNRAFTDYNAAAERADGFKVEQLAQVTLMLRLGLTSGMQPDMLAVVEAVEDVDWLSVMKVTVPNLQPKKIGAYEGFAGTGTGIGSGAERTVFGAMITPRTLLFGFSEAWLKTSLRVAQQRPSELAWRTLASQHADAVVLAAVDHTAISPMVEAAIFASPGPVTLAGAGTFAPLWEDVQTSCLALRTTPKIKAQLVVQCRSPEGATRAKKTFVALATLLGNLAAGHGSFGLNSMSLPREVTEPMWRYAAKLGEHVEASIDGQTVTATSTLDASAGDVLNGLFELIGRGAFAATQADLREKMERVVAGIQAYASDHGRYPTAIVLGPDKKTPHSWRVAILPYLDDDDADDVYDRYNFDEPWDAPANREVLNAMPDVYRYRLMPAGTTSTSIFALTGAETFFQEAHAATGRDAGVAEIFRSPGIMIVAGDRDIPWTKPADVEIDVDAPLPHLGLISEGVVVGFSTGDVRTVFDDERRETLRRLLTPVSQPTGAPNEAE